MKEDPAVIARRKAFLMSSTPEVLRNKVAEAREREQEVEEEGGPPIVFFPTNLNCHVLQHECLGQEAQHLDCKAQVELHFRTDGTSVSPSLPNTKPRDLLPNLALLRDKTTPMTRSLEKVVRLDESCVLATLEERAEKRKSFPFRLVHNSFRP